MNRMIEKETFLSHLETLGQSLAKTGKKENGVIFFVLFFQFLVTFLPHRVPLLQDNPMK